MIGSGLTLQDICRLDDMPDRSTVYEWLGKYPELSDMYARAREERADMVADEIVMIADTADDPNKARVQIDARKWWAAKVNPKKYGDKVQSENTITIGFTEQFEDFVRRLDQAPARKLMIEARAVEVVDE